MSPETFEFYFPFMAAAICIAFGVRFLLNDRAGPAYVSFILGVTLIPLLSWAKAGEKLLPYFFR